MWRGTKLLACVLCAGVTVAWLAATAVEAQNPTRTAQVPRYVIPVGADPAADAAGDDPDMNSLKAEIDELRATVSRLEERLAEIENRGGIQLLDLQATPNVRVVPWNPAPSVRERRPQGEINGVPYYVIPLGKE